MKTFVLGLLKTIGVKIGGVGAWLLGLLVEYAYRKVVDAIEQKRLESEIKKQDQILYEEYRTKVASGTLSREERRNLALRLLNRLP